MCSDSDFAYRKFYFNPSFQFKQFYWYSFFSWKKLEKKDRLFNIQWNLTYFWNKYVITEYKRKFNQLFFVLSAIAIIYVSDKRERNNALCEFAQEYLSQRVRVATVLLPIFWICSQYIQYHRHPRKRVFWITSLIRSDVEFTYQIIFIDKFSSRRKSQHAYMKLYCNTLFQFNFNIR